MSWEDKHPSVLELEEATAENDYRASVERLRPFIILKPTLFSIDGDKWCCIYGESLMNGVAGFGESPDLASRDFDRAWYEHYPESRSFSNPKTQAHATVNGPLTEY